MAHPVGAQRRLCVVSSPGGPSPSSVQGLGRGHLWRLIQPSTGMGPGSREDREGRVGPGPCPLHAGPPLGFGQAAVCG